MKDEENRSLEAPGALTHRLQHPTAFKIQNGHQGAPKWPTGSEKIFGCSCQLLLNKLFDLSTPSRRKVGNREKRGKNRGKKLQKYKPSSEGGTHSLPATPHHLQNPKWLPGAPKWPMGSGKVPTPRFLGVLSNFR